MGNIVIKLPDGNKKELAAGSNGFDLANSIVLTGRDYPQKLVLDVGHRHPVQGWLHLPSFDLLFTRVFVSCRHRARAWMYACLCVCTRVWMVK